MILDGLLHFAILCAAAMGALYSIEIFGGKPEAVASGLVAGAVVLGLIVITFSTYLRQQHNMTDDLGHEPVNNAPLWALTVVAVILAIGVSLLIHHMSQPGGYVSVREQARIQGVPEAQIEELEKEAIAHGVDEDRLRNRWVALIDISRVFRQSVTVLSILLFMVVAQIAQLAFFSARVQTVGKHVMKIRIVDSSTGNPPSWGRLVILRTVINGLIVCIPLIGFIYLVLDYSFVFRSERKCIHDYIAGTHVESNGLA